FRHRHAVPHPSADRGRQGARAGADRGRALPAVARCADDAGSGPGRLRGELMAVAGGAGRHAGNHRVAAQRDRERGAARRRRAPVARRPGAGHRRRQSGARQYAPACGSRALGPGRARFRRDHQLKRGNSMSDAQGPARSGPLTALRVLDLGTMVAGPVAATLMGDFGADVIKIEQPGVGDTIRGLGPFVNEEGLWWTVEGRNKRSITLDLRQEAGQDLLKRLVADADVLVENFRPGTLERWGLDYEALARVNPGLVMLSVSGFGQTGPNAQRAGYDRIALAFSGVMDMTGFPDRPPVRVGVSVADYSTATMGAFA